MGVAIIISKIKSESINSTSPQKCQLKVVHFIIKVVCFKFEHCWLQNKNIMWVLRNMNKSHVPSNMVKYWWSSGRCRGGPDYHSCGSSLLMYVFPGQFDSERMHPHGIKYKSFLGVSYKPYPNQLNQIKNIYLLIRCFQ